VEMKKAVIGDGTKVPHLTYLGDVQVGSKTNIGAGTITCNYDGFGKHLTTIGRGVFIGSDSTLVAPVRIGDGAYVAAGSTITENVPPDGLGIARGQQVNKPRWASRKRREMAAAQHSSKRARPRKKSKMRSKKTRRR
jgi:bifunctional UDP-N-acetylglucosamine pyrophosphorylase / glucosamine-1-phosphate N-acetyltransferase